MALYIIEKGNKTYITNLMGDVEYKNPREFLKNFHLCSILPAILKDAKMQLPNEKIKELALKKAEEIAESQISSIEHMELPTQIETLLDYDLSKKEIEKLLKGLSITKSQLGAIFIQAGEKGYLFSNYIFDGNPKSYKECELPSFIRIKDDGDVETYGKHQLSEGQLKDIVIQSKKIIARFLDKNDHWHCFYQTQNGVYGKEKGTYHGCSPHIHYISDSFGVAREDFIKGLKGGHVPSSPIHILLIE